MTPAACRSFSSDTDAVALTGIPKTVTCFTNPFDFSAGTAGEPLLLLLLLPLPLLLHPAMSTTNKTMYNFCKLPPLLILELNSSRSLANAGLPYDYGDAGKSIG
jgi:hypothetical protein